ncbi:MAG: fumarate reductase iron-sulfur subunit [Nitrospiraceae bacterium]
MPNRKLTFSIFRYNPFDPNSKPRLQDFELEETPRMTLFTVLTRIREELDPGLQFDFVCRSAICGSCAMLVNGRPRLACRTRTEELPNKITLLPLPFFHLIGDLSVDTGSWFREMGRRIESWIHSNRSFDPEAEEERMSDREAQVIYELDRCIECGCCLAACATAQMRGDFLGAAGLVRLARFLVDPRDRRSDAEVFEVVGTDDGIFGCIGLLACQDFCPKDLPLGTQMAYLRRKLARASFRRQLN